MEDKLPSLPLSESEVLNLLSKKHCRQSLRVLQNSTLPLTSIELAHRIADREYDTPSNQEVQNIHRALHHNDLPRLAEAEVIGYDSTEQTIHPGENFDDMLNFLAKVDETDLPWCGE